MVFAPIFSAATAARLLLVGLMTCSSSRNRTHSGVMAYRTSSFSSIGRRASSTMPLSASASSLYQISSSMIPPPVQSKLKSSAATSRKAAATTTKTTTTRLYSGSRGSEELDEVADRARKILGRGGYYDNIASSGGRRSNNYNNDGNYLENRNYDDRDYNNRNNYGNRNYNSNRNYDDNSNDDYRYNDNNNNDERNFYNDRNYDRDRSSSLINSNRIRGGRGYMDNFGGGDYYYDNDYYNNGGGMTGYNSNYYNDYDYYYDQRQHRFPGGARISSILANPKIEVYLSELVLFSCFLASISTIPNLAPITETYIVWLENLVTFLFTAEFFSRWYVFYSIDTNLRIRNIANNNNWYQPVDFLVVILPLLVAITPKSALALIFPPWLLTTSGIVFLGLLRIIRLQRVLTDRGTFGQFIQAALGVPANSVKFWQLQLSRILLSVLTLFSVTSGLIYCTEHVANPKVKDYFTALQFGISTLKTFGFGSISPTTPEGRLVVTCAIVAAVAILPVQTASLLDTLRDKNPWNGNYNWSNWNNAWNSWNNNNRGGGRGEGLTRAGMRMDDYYNGNNNNFGSGGERVDRGFACRSCGERLHEINTDYCWNCGTNLFNDNDFRGKRGGGGGGGNRGMRYRRLV